MRRKNELTQILSEDIDDEVLKKMPEWFKRLRKAHLESDSVFRKHMT